MDQGILPGFDTSEEKYEAFRAKFQPKKTTDDCYTPENIYETVKNWAVEQYSLHGREIVRPFWPGADFRDLEYPQNCVVIDNPPFSILSDICKEYRIRHIDYFLFAPSLTLFAINSGRENYIVCGTQVTYENGANVATSFVTNLDGPKINVSGDLSTAIDRENRKNLDGVKTKHPKYDYPVSVATAAKLQKMANRGVSLEIAQEEAVFIRCLDEQKTHGKAIYGSGFLLSESAAAEKAAAEKAAAEKAAAEKDNVKIWELSAREKRIIQQLGKESL